jgi:hypothetical protein
LTEWIIAAVVFIVGLALIRPVIGRVKDRKRYPGLHAAAIALGMAFNQFLDPPKRDLGAESMKPPKPVEDNDAGEGGDKTTRDDTGR